MCDKEMIVIMPQDLSPAFGRIADIALSEKKYRLIRNKDELTDLSGKKILFIVELNDSGICIELYKILDKLNEFGNQCMKDSIGSIVIHSKNELYTRSVARKIILHANMCGCIFPGRPLTEATGSYKNLISYKKLYPDLTNEDILLMLCKETVKRLEDFYEPKFENPNILVLHASNYNTSNTLLLWQMIKNNLNSTNINEIHISNGTIKDCKACSFKACTHFAEQNACFYGGVMVEEVYPAILACDILILLCPNYNDSLSANLTAVINRFTALFRNNDFSGKYLYSVIVSGHCGSDLIAEQLISAININKKFILPPYFSITETANDKNSISEVENISTKAENFARNIKTRSI